MGEGAQCGSDIGEPEQSGQGDGEDGFLALPAGLELGDRALDAADLCDMGEVDGVIERRAGEQAALLQAPVALIEGLGAQGGNAPGSVP